MKVSQSIYRRRQVGCGLCRSYEVRLGPEKTIWMGGRDGCLLCAGRGCLTSPAYGQNWHETSYWQRGFRRA